jgi:uncharacterized membrane protein YcgQ (UPF0703/DUF1980 family)
MTSMRTALAALLLYLVVACQSLGLAPARSLDDRLAYAYGVHTAVVEVISSAAQTGQLKPQEARQAANLAENSRQLLDAAKAIEQTDAKGASSRLTLATAVLDQLQAYLKSRGK